MGLFNRNKNLITSEYSGSLDNLPTISESELHEVLYSHDGILFTKEFILKENIMIKLRKKGLSNNVIAVYYKDVGSHNSAIIIVKTKSGAVGIYDETAEVEKAAYNYSKNSPTGVKLAIGPNVSFGQLAYDHSETLIKNKVNSW